jgi:hypothetical protein
VPLRLDRRRLFLPAVSLVLGGVTFAAFAVSDRVVDGLKSGVVIVALGALIYLGTGRSETLRGLSLGRDERFEMIDLRATSFAGLAVLIVLIVCWIVDLASGHDGSPYGSLLAVSGISYVAALVYLRRRV